MTLWTDIEILRHVDAAEKREHGTVGNGLDMLRALAAERGVALDDGDYGRFLHELFVLQAAGLLSWQLMQSPGRVRQITPAEPLDFLNNSRDFSLTYEGRNQAQGRVILVPLPDPAEDDGRMIASLTLEDIANAMTVHYDTEQAYRFLVESGISPEYLQFARGYTSEEMTKALVALAAGSSGQRRELRELIGAWLNDELHTGPFEEDRDTIERSLARQGWFVEDGRLVSGQPVRKSRDASAPAPKLDELHPMVWAAAQPQWKAGHLHDAVMAASKAVNAMLESKVGRSDVSEVKLVTEAFSEKPPTDSARRLRFPDIDGEQTRASVMAGVLSFGVGCFKAIRNPLGHLLDDQHDITEQEALEQLAAWSLFARWIDQATVTTAD